MNESSFENPFLKKETSNRECFFRKMFEKCSLEENCAKCSRKGLEFDGDGAVATIRRKSEAEKEYYSIIQAKGDADFVLDERLITDDYYVFFQRDEFKEAA
ncbi:MAG TPA: hypothetical protein DEA43_02575 [Candidatus Moranbacteria bacterium]|nr:hypothetical protein [Candidatus Moranbacteria bacterium]HBT45748.1 hypothetical protein [Candidatus Moranbacteria bacterium]